MLCLRERSGYPPSPILVNGERVGKVKAFAHSPTLGTQAGFVLFDNADAMAAAGFSVRDRAGSEHALTVHALPFFDPEKHIPRGIEAMEFKA
jgi:glycine cleavage system aminomethyltransferase T